MEQKTATELEKDYALLARFQRWYRSQNKHTQNAVAIFGVAAVPVLAYGALLAVGGGVIVAGALGGVAVRYGLPALPYVFPTLRSKLYPFYNFHKDSKTVEERRAALEEEWQKVSAQGMTYEDFRKSSKVRKQYTRSQYMDTGIRAAATAVTGFAAFGVTHVRSNMLEYAATRVGDFMVYGERWVQRFFRTIVLLLSGSVDTAHAASWWGEDSGVRAERPQGVPLVEDGWTEVNRQRTIKLFRVHIEWMEQVLKKYEGVMGTRNEEYAGRVETIREGIKQLKATLKALENTKDFSKIRSFKGINYFEYYVRGTYLAAAELDALPKHGHVWRKGRVWRLRDIVGIGFKYAGYDLLPQESARALFELFTMITHYGLAPKGLVVTEGWHPEHGPKGQHGSRDGSWTSKHANGTAFDVRPPSFKPYDIAMMLWLGYTNEYFDVKFEPHKMDPSGKLRAQVKWYLTAIWPFGMGMTEAEAEELLKPRSKGGRGMWGNADYTNGPHYHISVEKPPRPPVPRAPQRV